LDEKEEEKEEEEEEQQQQHWALADSAWWKHWSHASYLRLSFSCRLYLPSSVLPKAAQFLFWSSWSSPEDFTAASVVVFRREVTKQT